MSSTWREVTTSWFMPCSRAPSWALIGLSIHILLMQKCYCLQHIENHVQWTKLSNTVIKNMGGSSEKSKDIAWNSKMKPMILKKNLLKKHATVKFVKFSVTNTKKYWNYVKVIGESSFIVNTAVFILPIIMIMETHYLFWNFKKIWNISNKTFLKILALLVASHLFFLCSLM